MIVVPQNYEEEIVAYRYGKLSGEPVFEKPEKRERVKMIKEAEDLIGAGHELAKTQSHDPRCLLHGCTCGVMVVRKKALSDYWKHYRAYRSCL